MQRVWQAAQRHEFLVAIVAWLVAMIVLADPVKGTIGQLLAFGFLLLTGTVMKASSPGRMILNGIVGGVAGMVPLYVGAIVRMLITGGTGREGESAFSLLIESPFWLALLSPIGAIIGVVGAAVRMIFADAWREQAAKGS